eukprot:gene7562-2936_t
MCACVYVWSFASLLQAGPDKNDAESAPSLSDLANAAFRRGKHPLPPA